MQPNSMRAARTLGYLTVLIAANLTGAAGAEESQLGLRVPEGFRVELYADDALAHDIFSMTVDSRGRVVVAGKEYVKILHDDGGDGRADRATLFSSVPKSGAHGLCFDGDDLICTGDNALLRLRDANGDGRADGPPEILAKLNHPEHGANGLTRGPDGWFYLACGNDAGVTAELAKTKRSPVVKPQCGAIVRFSPDGRRSEIVAHGFRNIYDLDFGSTGHLFTVDSDGERDQYLPWYSPTRVFDVATGQHHGWVQRGWQHSWNRPAYFCDSMSRAANLGRGSPTGVCTYRHRQFPPAYRDAIFSCCWTLGRVYALRPVASPTSGGVEIDGAQVFLETAGETGFAPVDVVVGTQGELFVAIGGRQTRGSVFRVTYVGERGEAKPAISPASDLDRVLRADQPLAAWSRARWLPVARNLTRDALRQAIEDAKRSPAERIRAAEVLAELHEGVDVKLATAIAQEVLVAAAAPGEGTPLSSDASPRQLVLAEVVRLLSTSGADSGTLELLARVTRQESPPQVRRAAWEAIGRIDRSLVSRSELVERALGEVGDAHVRATAIWAVRDCRLPEPWMSPTYFARLGRRRWELARDDAAAPTAEWLAQLAAMLAKIATDPGRLEVLRVAQLELGDVRSEPTRPPVHAGYIANLPERISAGPARVALLRALVDALPETASASLETGDQMSWDVVRELTRLLGMLGADDPRLLARYGRWLDAARERSVEDALHLLIVLTLLPGERPADLTRAAANALLSLHETMAAKSQYPSRNWPVHVGQVCELLLQRDPALAGALLESPRFGRPEHSLFALRLDVNLRPAAARRMLVHAQESDEEVEWTADFIELIQTLPADQALPPLRSRWNDFLLRDSIATVLAKHRQPEDRARFVESLASIQPAVVIGASDALRAIGGTAQDDEIGKAYQALRQGTLDKDAGPTRAALHGLLAQWVGTTADMPTREAKASDFLQAWTARLRKARPALSELLDAPGGLDGAAWLKRLDAIDWSAGNVERGKMVFEKRSCARCHRAADRLGPDLAGAAGRFSSRDLFVAIVDPNRDVAPLYQASQVVTKSGKVYHGLIVYESPEGTLIQTTPDQTVRVAGDEITGIRKSRQSLMPLGLLNGANDGELIDLHAYLKTLKGK